MLCPKDMVQMHQKNKVGGGDSQDNFYNTWELKECPVCHSAYVEYYEAIKLPDNVVKKIEGGEIEPRPLIFRNKIKVCKNI